MAGNKRKDTLEIYRDKENLWRWRYTASNGRILAVSSESYEHRSHCKTIALQVIGGSEWREDDVEIAEQA